MIIIIRQCTFDFILYAKTDLPHSNQNVMFTDGMGFQIVPVVKERETNAALVPGVLAAFVSGVPAQRISVLVPFSASVARPVFI